MTTSLCLLDLMRSEGDQRETTYGNHSWSGRGGGGGGEPIAALQMVIMVWPDHLWRDMHQWNCMYRGNNCMEHSGIVTILNSNRFPHAQSYPWWALVWYHRYHGGPKCRVHGKCALNKIPARYLSCTELHRGRSGNIHAHVQAMGVMLANLGTHHLMSQEARSHS